MITKAYIGIDPGASGSICLLIPKNKIIHFVNTTELPVAIFASIKQIEKDYDLAPIMMENVTSIPGASAGSNFTFGKNVGLLEGIIKCTGLGIDFVRPKEWQKSIGVKMPTIKKGSKKKKHTPKELKVAVAKRALELYPTAKIHGPKGGLLDGKSDALMIAHYCREKYA